MAGGSCERRLRVMAAEDVTVVEQLYQALEAGDRAAYRVLLDPQVEWHFMDGFAHGGVRRGVDAIIDETFRPLMSDFDEWHIVVDEILPAEGAVVGLGHYRVRARSTGRDASIPLPAARRCGGAGAAIHGHGSVRPGVGSGAMTP